MFQLKCTEREIDLNDKVTENIQRIKSKVDSDDLIGINDENSMQMKNNSETEEPQLSEGNSEIQQPKKRKKEIPHSSGEDLQVK